MRTKLFGKLGVTILLAAGLASLPNKTFADIYTFEFTGNLDSSAIGQTYNGLLLDNGTFFDVSFSFDSASSVGPAPGGTALRDKSGMSSITLSNTFGTTSLAGNNTIALITRGVPGQVRLMSFANDIASPTAIDMEIRNLGGSSFPDSSPATGIQVLETNSPANDTFLLRIDGTYTMSGVVSSVSYSIQPVPEPSVFALGVLGAAGALTLRRRNPR